MRIRVSIHAWVLGGVVLALLPKLAGLTSRRTMCAGQRDLCGEKEVFVYASEKAEAGSAIWAYEGR